VGEPRVAPDPFGKTTNLGSPVNTIAAEFWARFSPRWPEDGSILYFGRCMTCNHDSDIYQAIWRVTPPPSFIRGEANDDGKLDLSDAVFILGFLFLGATEPTCREALDANDDGGIDIADAISLLGHLFLDLRRRFPDWVSVRHLTDRPHWVARALAAV
jgi:hypothetical protein